MTVEIRALQPGDHADWKRLWSDYLAFYKARVPEAVYDTTWARLFDGGEFEPRGMIATLGGRAVGLVHYIEHRSCWSQANKCYLQDLYADPEVRGTGIGRRLIEEVYGEADRRGLAGVYWLTHESNATARHLYERVARPTGFIRYER